VWVLVVCSKYKFMEMNTQTRKAAIKAKLPDIERTLAAVTYLQSRTVRVPLSQREEERKKEREGEREIKRELV
jgi:hypothetical protein